MKLEWFVYHYNINKDCIEPYDVLHYRQELLQTLKNSVISKEEFSEKLNKEMIQQYWSRSEYELILEKDNELLYLKPWVGSRNADKVKILAVDTEQFSWSAFAKSKEIHWWRNSNTAKFDIYNQLRFMWDNFIDYCWTNT